VNVDGVQVSYLEVGTGERAVVLLHGFPLRAEMWAPQLATLSPLARIVAPDLAGFGRSDVAPEPLRHTMADYVAQVAGLLRALGLQRVVLGGLSMGGYVAFSFLRRHPELVEALVLADTRAAADAKEVADRRSAQQDQIVAEGTTALRESFLEGLLGRTTSEGRPALVRRVRGLTDHPPDAFLAALQAMKSRPDCSADLPGIEVPTLVLVGEEDRLSPPAEVRAWQEAIPGSRLAVLPRAGHLSNLEAPDDFNAAVAAFLADLPPPGSAVYPED